MVSGSPSHLTSRRFCRDVFDPVGLVDTIVSREVQRLGVKPHSWALSNSDCIYILYLLCLNIQGRFLFQFHPWLAWDDWRLSCTWPDLRDHFQGYSILYAYCAEDLMDIFQHDLAVLGFPLPNLGVQFHWQVAKKSHSSRGYIPTYPNLCGL